MELQPDPAPYFSCAISLMDPGSGRLGAVMSIILPFAYVDYMLGLLDVSSTTLIATFSDNAILPMAATRCPALSGGLRGIHIWAPAFNSRAEVRRKWPGDSGPHWRRDITSCGSILLRWIQKSGNVNLWMFVSS